MPDFTSSSVSSLLEQADAQLSARNWPHAARTLQQAVLLDETGAALVAWGLACQQRGLLADSCSAFERLLLLADTRQDAELRALACNNLACLCRQLGEADLAASWQQQSWGAAQRHAVTAGTHVELGCDLSNRGNDALLAGDYSHAEHLFRLAIQWETERGTTDRLADDWGSLGLASALQGDLESACQHFQQAAELHRRAGDMRGLGCDLLHVAELCAVQGDWEPGLRIVAEARASLAEIAAQDLLEHAVELQQRLQRGWQLATFDVSRN